MVLSQFHANITEQNNLKMYNTKIGGESKVLYIISTFHIIQTSQKNAFSLYHQAKNNWIIFNNLDLNVPKFEFKKFIYFNGHSSFYSLFLWKGQMLLLWPYYCHHWYTAAAERVLRIRMCKQHGARTVEAPCTIPGFVFPCYLTYSTISSFLCLISNSKVRDQWATLRPGKVQ